jgi:hypothetical protein
VGGVRLRVLRCHLLGYVHYVYHPCFFTLKQKIDNSFSHAAQRRAAFLAQARTPKKNKVDIAITLKCALR